MPARKTAKKSPKKKAAAVPSSADWRITDRDEVVRRVQRARDEKQAITNHQPEHPVFSTFFAGSRDSLVGAR